MAISLKHLFTSGKSDGTDSTLVQPSNWNAEHTLLVGTGKLVGRTSVGTGAVEEITPGSGLTFAGGSLTANVTTVAGRTGAVTLSVTDITGAAPLASPTFTGTVNAAAGTFSGALSGSTIADSAGTIRPLISGTSQVTTSGTSKDFTGIPSWVRCITIVFNSVSLSATANLLVQLGISTGIETTGYASASSYASAAVDSSAANSTSGLIVRAGLAAASIGGIMQLVNISGNIWVASFTGARTDGNASAIIGGGTKTLTGVLDRVRITSTSTDTFDLGSVNIFYE